MRTRKIYAASSWRNLIYESVVGDMHSMGHRVYDFKNDKPYFRWHSPNEHWTREQYMDALARPESQIAYKVDFSHLEWCDTCVLIMPCNRSAHLEAGWAKGSGRDLFILLLDDESFEPELMYLMANAVVTNMADLEKCLAQGA